LQGWAPATRLSPIVRQHANLPEADVKAITRHFYQTEQPNRVIAALAPAVLHLASEGDETARKLVLDSAKPLLDLAVQVATKLFPATPLDSLSTGLSGPILTHPEVINALVLRSPLPLVPLTEAPIIGVQQLLARR
jgi:glucosamine kinase